MECDLEVLYIFGAHEPIRKAKTDYHKWPVNKGIQQADYKKQIWEDRHESLGTIAYIAGMLLEGY